MKIFTSVQKDGNSAICPLCTEKKLMLNNDVEIELTFKTKSSNQEAFFCFTYFCHSCGALFFTVKSSTTVHKNNDNHTIDEYVGKNIVVNETLGISENISYKLTKEN